MLDTTKQKSTLIDIRSVSRSFPKGSGEDLLVLEKVDLTIHSGEIVGLLGRSGSGKSTLLRIIAGLVTPSSGEAKCRGETIKGPPHGVAMVFQSFALFPWLTVLQNVELGLEALGIDSTERRTRALAAIDLIGLDGFESAYAKEFAGRLPPALVDRGTEGRLPIKSVLMVTHNIEEAVLMCDRILVFSSNPGRVAAELRVRFPHPRNRLDPAFRKMVDDIYALMTRRAPAARTAAPAPTASMQLHPVSTNLL